MQEVMPEIMPAGLAWKSSQHIHLICIVSWHDFHASTFGIHQIIMLA
jgi:hypothetical protein